MIYNGIAYIGYEEKWKNVKYKNIIKGKYQVSNLGRFRLKKNKKILFGNNPNNEKGYCRICLKCDDGKMRKFPMHRIVLSTFGHLDNDCEVNHKDGNKLVNALYNLENSSRLENAKHASINNLYKKGESHYRSNFTNNEVIQICERLQNGESISRIINEMDLHNRGDIYSNINKIINGDSWVDISSNYIFDYKKYHYKTYSYEDLFSMCDMIFSKGMKNREIVNKFPKYKEKKLINVLKKLRAKSVYKSVIDDYLSSTTIERVS